MSIFAKSTGNTREGQRDVRLVLPEVRRSVAIAMAFAFLCWAWHVWCHMHGSVLEQCFRLRHPSIPGTSAPWRSFARFVMRQNLQTAKNCRLKIHKKNV